MRSIALIFALATSLACAGPLPSALEQVRQLETTLKFDDLFPRRPYTGQGASVHGWSADDRYLAYSWNPWGSFYRDLYLYDSKTGQTKRLTTPETFMPFDREIKKALEFYKKEQERLDAWDKLSDADYREARQKHKDEQAKRREPNPSYPGVNNIVWANKSNEFLFSYKGDLFRWKLSDAAPTRLTDTRDSESPSEYLPDDSGFLFRRGGGLYRMKWNSLFAQQLDPKLPDGITGGVSNISPNGKYALVGGQKQGAPGRQVDYITYRDRFAKAERTGRGVAEDNFNGESYLFLYDIQESTLLDPENEPKPMEIHKWPGGQEWVETSLSDHPWSPDGESFVFVSWARDSKVMKLIEAIPNRKRVRTIWTGTSEGEHQSPGLASPMYSADGQKIILMLDKSGWRQIHVIDRITGEEKQLTKGEFETYPVKLSADGKGLLVRSSKEHLAKTNVYRVDLETGNFTPMTSWSGTWGEPTFAEKSDAFAGSFNSFSELGELRVVDGKDIKTLTQSHRKEAFWKVVTQKPEFFTFKNRHGDTIHGYMMLPPNFDKSKKAPLFMYVYGGPLGTGKSIVDGSFNSTSTMFAMYLTQVLGYVTVTIDPRGQSGYSAAHGRANWENPGKPQTEDLADCVKFMVENYNIDTTKVGLNGWSFGGFQTQHAMYNEPNVFTLGIAGAGPTQWQNYNTWYTGGVIGNSPAGDGNYLDKFSLTHVAKNLKGPLLLLHGIEDTNVLFQDTIAVYRKLLQAGKGDLVELALDPTGGHGMGGDMDNRDRHAIYLAFLVKHWGLPNGNQASVSTRNPN